MTSAHTFIPYPWQQPYWQHFLQQIDKERLPHAMLLSGQKGIGKWHYAHAMANYLLCLSPKSGLACNQCRSCQLNGAGTHPDKTVVMPDEPGKQIKIDQIRQLSALVATTAQQGGRKVVLLGPIEQLNTNAANALLKNLEEPAGDTFFILVSHVISGVMATIRSRCQILSFPVPDKQLSMAWLNELGLNEDVDAIITLAAGAPLTAKTLLDGEITEQLNTFYGNLLKAQKVAPAVDISLVKEWLELDLLSVVEWWIQVLQSVVKQSYQPIARHVKSLDFLKMINEIQTRAMDYNQQWLFRFMDKLLQTKQQLLQGANPNRQLLLEELLLDWYAIIKTAEN